MPKYLVKETRTIYREYRLESEESSEEVRSKLEYEDVLVDSGLESLSVEVQEVS